MSTPSAAAAMPVLRVRGLSKEYRLYASARQRLKSLLTGRANVSVRSSPFLLNS